MHKIAVISDSHWGSVRLKMFADIARRERFDEIVHCGDGVSDAKWLEKELGIPVKMVGGNCDPRWGCDREIVFSIGGVRFMALHGDLYGVKYDYSALSYHAEEACVQVVLFGHTHRAFAGYVGNVMMINPGALKEGRYAEIQIRDGQAVPFLKEF